MSTSKIILPRFYFVIVTALFSLIQSSFALQIYAHRGGRGLAPENTLCAYKQAVALGVDYVDMDVNMTQDGVLVVTHNISLNPDITRDAKQHWWQSNNTLIKSLKLAKLQTFSVGKIKPDSRYAKLFMRQKPCSSCKIPTLESVIQHVQRWSHGRVGFQIEVKSDFLHPSWTYSPNILAKAVMDIVHRYHIRNKTEIQSFDFRCLRAIQLLDPSMKTAYLTDYQTPIHDVPRRVHHLGGRLWDPQDDEVNSQNIAEAHRLGLKVVVWSWPENSGKVFDDRRMRQLIRWHVDGIITDRPDKLRLLMQHLHLRTPQKIKI